LGGVEVFEGLELWPPPPDFLASCELWLAGYFKGCLRKRVCAGG
jgi:hypothetical protein